MCAGFDVGGVGIAPVGVRVAGFDVGVVGIAPVGVCGLVGG